MRTGPGWDGKGPRLSVVPVANGSPATPGAPERHRAWDASPVPGANPITAAAAAQRAAAGRLRASQGAVTVAEAKLAEAVAKAPQHGPVLQRALDAEQAATTREAAAVAAVTDAGRAAADTAGAVVVAVAKREDLDTATKPVTAGQFVAADEAIARGERASKAAQDGLDGALRAADTAREATFAATAAVVVARGEPDVVPWQVVAAQEAVRAARQARAAAMSEHEAARADLATLRSRAAEGDPVAQDKRQHFYDLEEFVVDYLLPNWERRLAADQGPQLRWCAHWFEHLEVVTRLGHLWEAFEVMRREEAPAMSTFWRDHVDHHMGVIVDAAGPLQRCDDAGAHEVLPVWRTVPAPSMFPGQDSAETETERRELMRKYSTPTGQGDEA